MRKSFILLLIFLLSSVQITQAQDDIFLPIIIKSGDCMTEIAIFQLTDGTTTIDLLQPGSGFGVTEWRPQTPPIIPTYQSSPLSSGRELSSYKLDNATETIEYNVNGLDQDNVIEQLQDARRLLIQGLDFHVVDWQDNLVYLIAKAKCETNTRYALVQMVQMGDDDFPFGQPFAGNPNQLMSDMSWIIERGNWLGNIPGMGECANISSVQEWIFVSDEWALNTALPVGTAAGLLQIENGDIFAGDSGGNILRSDDNGASWAVQSTLPSVAPISFTQVRNGDVYAVDFTQGILKSTNNGIGWAVNFTALGEATGSVIETNDGVLMFGAESGVYKSLNAGSSWTKVAFTSSVSIAFFVFYDSDEDVILVGGFADNQLWRSIDNGLNWTLVFSAEDDVTGIEKLTDGSYLLGTKLSTGVLTGQFHRSTDDGLTWPIHSDPTFLINQGGLATKNILQASDGNIYALDGASNRVQISSDAGLNWMEDTTIGGLGQSLLETADNSIYATNGTGGDIYKKTAQAVNMGIGSTCTNGKTYISNKQNIANLTHIKIDDGGVFTDIFPIASFPQTLLPAIPVVNDAIYFGIDTSFPESGPFSSLVFDIDTPASSTTSYTIVLEYYNGAWELLEVEDSTEISNRVFAALNIKSIHWRNPSDWIAVTIDSITGFFVRARVAAISGTLTPPTQQNRDIFTIVNAYIEVDDDDILGDIQSLAELKVKNESDSGGLPIIKVSGTHDGANNSATLDDSTATFITDGVQLGWFVRNTTDSSTGYITAITEIQVTATLIGGTDNDWDTNDAYQIISGPDLWSNRVLAGLRSISRGNNFTSFINISDEQNVDGVTVTVGTNSTFGNDVVTPTGRRLTYGSLAGDTSFIDRVTITISTDIVKDFYGKFHLFLRGRQVTGSAGDITTRVQIKTSSGGITFTTPEVTFSGTNDWELLDLDAITLPAGGRSIKPSDLGDVGTITIQAKNDSGGSRDVYYYDLVWIPTDEWAGDFTDQADINDSIIGKQNNIKHFIDMDSVTNPKVIGSSVVRLDDSDEKISAIYEFAANGHVMLQANATQRLWVLSAHIGSNDEWLSEPWVAWSVQAFKNEQYLSMRGSR